jgi:RES domain-containing protein
MLVYRITIQKWASSLTGSGIAGRWNSQGIPVLYTASNRSLACLENLVHRRSLGLDGMFRIVTLYIPSSVRGEILSLKTLKHGWHDNSEKAIEQCQFLGDRWQREGKHLWMKVPSAIVPEEHNILINPSHPAVSKIKITVVDRFVFDRRLG